jgi:hypothetical protein
LGFAAPPETYLPWLCAPSVVPGHTGDDAPDRAFIVEQMVDRIKEINPQSGADALRELRRAFPDSPLEFRVRALEASMNRSDLPKAC